jgi:hypothetical protein
MPGRPVADPRSRPDRAAVAERRARSLEEPLDVRLRRGRPFVLLEVRNPLHRTMHEVLLPEFPSRESALCTCTDFARRGLGTCKHIEAGVRWLGEHPGTDPIESPPRLGARAARIWRRADAGLAAALRGGEIDPVRWRRAGRALIDAP